MKTSIRVLCFDFLTSLLQVKFFHQRRLQELRQSLIFYVEVSPDHLCHLLTMNITAMIAHLQGQIKCSRESQASLTGCLAKMKEFPLPQVSCLFVGLCLHLISFQVKESMFDPNDNE